MADDSGNDSPLVNFVEKVLDDGHGISDNAFVALKVLLADYYDSRPFPSKLQKMVDCAEASIGRVYIKEDWDE